MNDKVNDTVLPRRLLMATDMSARCDRALSRAALLARGWRSTLAVVHAINPSEASRRDSMALMAPSWRRPEHWASVQERRLRADLSAEGIEAAAIVAVGSPWEIVLSTAERERACLVVLGIAKDAQMERIQSGSTVDSLVRKSKAPVLNVRARPRTDYRHVVVATDFSSPSAHALRLAAAWFAQARLTLFHGYVPPGQGAVATTASESWHRTFTDECERFVVESGVPAPVARSTDRLIEQGDPGRLLSDYVCSSEVDLVVLGSHGRSGLARALLGSTAEHLLHTLDCDTLVVRPA